MLSQYAEWKFQRFPTIVESDSCDQTLNASSFVPRAWYSNDAKYKATGQLILTSDMILSIPNSRHYELWAKCCLTSSKDVHYFLTAHPSSATTCSYPDWLYWGGACKHLHTFQRLIQSWIQHKQIAFAFHFPGTKVEAKTIEENNMRWYGAGYRDTVTLPGSISNLHLIQAGAANLQESLPTTSIAEVLPLYTMEDVTNPEALLQQAVDPATALDDAIEKPTRIEDNGLLHVDLCNSESSFTDNAIAIRFQNQL